MAIDSEWEKFHGGPAESRATRLHATISRLGRININANLHRQLGRPLAVHLFYNRRRDQIALQPTSSRLPEAFPVKEFGTGSYYIPANTFCTHFGIRIDATHKFTRPQISPEGRLILNLSETTLVTRTRRKRRSREG